MKYKILFLIVLVWILHINLSAQNYKTVGSKEYELYQRIDSQCNILLNNKSLGGAFISDFEHLFETADSTLAFPIVKKITNTMLELRESKGYYLILKYKNKFYHRFFRNAQDIGNGRVYTIPEVLTKWASTKEKQDFADYLYNSDYLNQKRDREEIKTVKWIFNLVSDGTEHLRYKQTSPDNAVRYQNLESIFNYSQYNNDDER